jgi:hypothetical protein
MSNVAARLFAALPWNTGEEWRVQVVIKLDV